MPSVRVRYFGRLRELLNIKKEEYEVNDDSTLSDVLLKYIPERHKEVSKTWSETVFRTIQGEILRNKDETPLLRNYLVLIGGKSASLNSRLKDGDEIAILPPFGGG